MVVVEIEAAGATGSNENARTSEKRERSKRPLPFFYPEFTNHPLNRAVEYFTPMANTGPRGDSHHQLEGMFKKVRPVLS